LEPKKLTGRKRPLVQSHRLADSERPVAMKDWQGSFFFDQLTDKVWWGLGDGHPGILMANPDLRAIVREKIDKNLNYPGNWNWTEPMYGDDRVLAGWVMKDDADGKYYIELWGGDETGKIQGFIPEGTKQRIENALQEQYDVPVKSIESHIKEAAQGIGYTWIYDTKTGITYWGYSHPVIMKDSGIYPEIKDAFRTSSDRFFFGEYSPWSGPHFDSFWEGEKGTIPSVILKQQVLEAVKASYDQKENLSESHVKQTTEVIEIGQVKEEDYYERTTRIPFVYSPTEDKLFIGPYGAHHPELIWAAYGLDAPKSEWSSDDYARKEEIAMSLEDDQGNLGIIIEDKKLIVYWAEPSDNCRRALLTRYPGFKEEVHGWDYISDHFPNPPPAESHVKESSVTDGELHSNWGEQCFIYIKSPDYPDGRLVLSPRRNWIHPDMIHFLASCGELSPRSDTYVPGWIVYDDETTKLGPYEDPTPQGIYMHTFDERTTPSLRNEAMDAVKQLLPDYPVYDEISPWNERIGSSGWE
jgi:hypothetical protein